MFQYISILMIFLLVLGCTDENSKDNSNRNINKFYQEVLSNQNKFKVEVTTQNEKSLSVGDYHNWVVTLSAESNKYVKDALFSIDGGMPSHGHGLPTRPFVTKYLGDGRYLLEGMKFNMSGRWVVYITIQVGGLRDTAEFSFDVKY